MLLFYSVTTDVFLRHIEYLELRLNCYIFTYFYKCASRPSRRYSRWKVWDKKKLVRTVTLEALIATLSTIYRTVQPTFPNLSFTILTKKISYSWLHTTDFPLSMFWITVKVELTHIFRKCLHNVGQNTREYVNYSASLQWTMRFPQK